MRKIDNKQKSCFFSLVGLVVLMTTITLWSVDSLPLGDFRVVVLIGTALTSWFGYAMLVYGLFRKFQPSSCGLISSGSQAEFVAQVNICFHLAFFRILMKNALLPLPAYSLLNKWLGAKIGDNSYCAGYIMDPHLTEMGDNSLIGDDALVMALRPKVCPVSRQVCT